MIHDHDGHKYHRIDHDYFYNADKNSSVSILQLLILVIVSGGLEAIPGDTGPKARIPAGPDILWAF